MLPTKAGRLNALNSCDTSENIMLRKIGIIGDVHAEDHHLELAITTLSTAGAEALLCTGDITDGSGDLDRCVELLVKHDVITVRGNHDRWVLQNKARPRAGLFWDNFFTQNSTFCELNLPGVNSSSQDTHFGGKFLG